MTTEEFIKKVKALSEDEREGTKVVTCTDGGVLIQKPLRAGGYFDVACVSNGSRTWHFFNQCYVPGCVLKLMGELVNDEYWGKFLLLNGEPEDSFCNFFIIGDDGQLYPRCEDNLDELVKFACTKEELGELKNGFSRRMREAIDVLAVPFSEVASKMEKD